MRKNINARLLYIEMKKETASCGLCGSADHLPLLDRDRYGMGLSSVICKKCGFIFTNPRPTQEEMNHFYRETYRLFYTGNPAPSVEYKDHLTLLKRQWFYNRVRSSLERRLIFDPAILDVGCGSGVLLGVFRKNLPQSRLYGVEPFVEYAKFAEKKNGAEVHCTDVDNFILEQKTLAGSLDLITLYHVLEHLYNPVEKLLKLREFLKPDGLLLVQVPNALSPHWQNTAQMFHIAHVNHFSMGVLKKAFELSGFTVEKVFTGSHPANPRAMTFLGRRSEIIKVREHLSPVPPQDVEFVRRFIRSNSYKPKKQGQKKRKGFMTEPLRLFHRAVELHSNFGMIKMLKHATKYALRRPLSLLRKIRELIVMPLKRAWWRSRSHSVLKKLISGQRVLIIGSGPSANELETIPDDMRILTCNAGLRLFVKKNIGRRPDLFLCRKKAMIEDYRDVPDLLAAFKTNLFIMDDLKFVENQPKLKGAYTHLIMDHQKDNFYLKRLVQPLRLAQLSTDRVQWTSAGVRLLQYALYFGAAKIYLVGIDLNHSGYFWGEKQRYEHSGAVIRHKHTIDHDFVKLMAARCSHIYSLSKNSPITRYIHHKDFVEKTSEECLFRSVR